MSTHVVETSDLRLHGLKMGPKMYPEIECIRAVHILQEAILECSMRAGPFNSGKILAKANLRMPSLM